MPENLIYFYILHNNRFNLINQLLFPNSEYSLLSKHTTHDMIQFSSFRFSGGIRKMVNMNRIMDLYDSFWTPEIQFCSSS